MKSDWLTMECNNNYYSSTVTVYIGSGRKDA